jgi:hypothetical protein
MPGPSIYMEDPKMSIKGSLWIILFVLISVSGSYLYRQFSSRAAKILYTVGYAEVLGDTIHVIHYSVNAKEYSDTIQRKVVPELVFVAYQVDSPSLNYILIDTIPIESLKGYGREYEELHSYQYKIVTER